MVKKVFYLAVLLLCELSAFAAGGKLRSLQLEKSSANWHVDHPKVVLAFGLLEEPLVNRYSRFARGYFASHLNSLFPGTSVEVIEAATGESVVNALRDPDTVGILFISHTYQTVSTHVSVALTADGHALPTDILSAATPALRFAGIFGCYGEGIPKEYEVEYEFERLPGHHMFFHNGAKYLSANFMFKDDIKSLMRKVLKELEKFGSGAPTVLTRGVANDLASEGTLRLRVKDVVPLIEPRYVYVNDHVVGVLGGSPRTSNNGSSYEEFQYKIPKVALSSRKNCILVKVSSSQLTPGSLVDDYLIESVTVDTPEESKGKVYAPALHLGESWMPRPVEPPEPPLKGSKSETKRQHLEYLIRAAQASTWIDRDPETWREVPLKGRFYIDCL